MNKIKIIALLQAIVFCASSYSFAAKKAMASHSKIKTVKKTVIKADPPPAPFYMYNSSPMISWETIPVPPSKSK